MVSTNDVYLSLVTKFYFTLIRLTETVKKKAHTAQFDRINLEQDCFEIMLSHCRRKLHGEYLPGEDRNLKAFGLLAGRKNNREIIISQCFPLLHNARQSEEHRNYMDEMMANHAIPSVTPFAERGWVAAPDELTKVLRKCRELDLLLVASYHMHRVAWPDDPIRDTPTTLDAILGSNSRLVMFILSMVNPASPKLKAFEEGAAEREIPIHYIGLINVTRTADGFINPDAVI